MTVHSTDFEILSERQPYADQIVVKVACPDGPAFYNEVEAWNTSAAICAGFGEKVEPWLKEGLKVEVQVSEVWELDPNTRKQVGVVRFYLT